MAKKKLTTPEAAVVEETPAPPVVPTPPEAPVAIPVPLRRRHGFAVRFLPNDVMEMGFIESRDERMAVFQPLARVSPFGVSRVGDPAALVSVPLTDLIDFD